MFGFLSMLSFLGGVAGSAVSFARRRERGDERALLLRREAKDSTFGGVGVTSALLPMASTSFVLFSLTIGAVDVVVAAICWEGAPERDNDLAPLCP